MGDEEELKQMIAGFRVSDLHLLLAFAGRNRAGRKSDLQDRALELLKLKSPSVHFKIRKIHQTLLQQLNAPHTTPPAVTSTAANSASIQISAVTSKSTNAGMQPHQNRGAYGAYPNPNAQQQHHQQQQQQQQQAYQRAMYSANSYLQQQQQHQYQAPQKPLIQPSPQLPVHPDVKLKRLPFYDHVGELIKPSSLVPQGNQRQQEGNFTFHLTPAQANAIGTSRDMRPGSRVDYLTQVQLRFCLLETTSEQEDCFPPGVLVKVNQKVCQLPNPIPPNKPGVEPKRPPRPVNITSLVKISPVVPNAITVFWSTDYTRGYVMAVHLVNKRTSEDLLHRLKSKGVRAADYTRGMIKDKLKEDGEIATTSLRVSIACPLGKMRMTTPCRASTCNHFQCFDASLFLQMNEKKPQWLCPVCNKPAVYDKLVIDGYFQDVLSSNKLPGECSEIQLYMDGSWAPLVIVKEQSCVLEKETPKKSQPEYKVDSSTVDKTEDKEDVTTITLSDSDDEPLMPRKKKAVEFHDGSTKAEPVSATSPPEKPKQQDPFVIVLDEDSPVSSPVSSTAAPPAYSATTVTNPYVDSYGYRY